MATTSIAATRWILQQPQVTSQGHQLPAGHPVVATPILGGLHHEYDFELVAA